MNYFSIGSDGSASCTFISTPNLPIGYSDGAPFISMNKYYTDYNKTKESNDKEVKKIAKVQ